MTVLHQPIPHEAELRFLTLPFAIKPGLGIGLETCVSFDRLRPWKSASRLHHPSAGGGSSDPSFARKLFINAQGFNKGPVRRDREPSLIANSH